MVLKITTFYVTILYENIKGKMYLNTNKFHNITLSYIIVNFTSAAFENIKYISLHIHKVVHYICQEQSSSIFK